MVAIAWAARAIIDALLLMFSCPVLLPATRASIQRMAGWLAVAVPTIAATALLATTGARVAVGLIAVPILMAIVWRGVLTPSEREGPARLLSAVSPKAEA